MDMIEYTSRDFVMAVAYCLAYDHWEEPPDRGTLRHLRDGEKPGTSEERLLEQMIEIARLVLQDIPDLTEEYKTHLRHIQEKALALDDPKIALLMGGATKIKQYVFESARLPEIRGASALLDRINLVDLPALFNLVSSDPGQDHRALEVRAQFAERRGAEPPDCPECVIYANGGELLAFAPIALAQKLTDGIEFLYTSETLVANSVAVWHPFSLVELAGGVEALEFWRQWEQKDRREFMAFLLGQDVVEELPKKKCFGELAAALAGEKLQRREGNPSLDGNGRVVRPPKSTPNWETLAYGQRCRSCERRIASREYALAGEQQMLCEACYQKLHVGWEWKRQWAAKFEDFLQRTGCEEFYYHVVRDGSSKDIRQECLPRKWDKQCLPDRPQDLNEIGQASTPEGYIGVIYADGNNMGALLEQLRSPAKYHHFAETVCEAIKGAVFREFSNSLHPDKVSREDRKNPKNREKIWIHPFEILSIGGDDLFLIVPAHKALPIAVQISRQVEERLFQDPFFQESIGYDPQQVHRCALDGNESVRVASQSKVGLSAGVLLADAKTPIFFLQNLVDQLLKSAKGYAKRLKKQKQDRYFGGTIDFMALKSVTMITSALSEFRESTLRLDEEHWLTARPYTLLELEKLIDTVRTLKKANFPRSQLYALRSALWEGRTASTVNYLYFTERLDKQDRENIRTVLDKRWCEGGPAPWRRNIASEAWETVLFDLIELYDFVEE